MVFVVRRDLAWQKQKLAVMTAHAALALFKKVYKAKNPALLQWVRDSVGGSTATAAAAGGAAAASCAALWCNQHTGLGEHNSLQPF